MVVLLLVFRGSPILFFGKGNVNQLQYSCLGNPRDRGAWWAAIYGVAQSWIWLNWFSLHACIGERNGNLLQYSCLGNPRDRGAWWAAVYGVAQSQTCMERLSRSSNSLWKQLIFKDGLFTFDGEGNGNPLQYSCLGNPMDREAWWATVPRITKSWIQLSTHTHKILRSKKYANTSGKDKIQMALRENLDRFIL